MQDIRVASITAEISANDSMVIIEGILPHFASGQEEELRASGNCDRKED